MPKRSKASVVNECRLHRLIHRPFVTKVSQLHQCHHYSSVTTTAVSPLQECHDYSSVTTTAVSRLQQCHNSKFVIFQETRLKVLKCYNFLRVQRRHNCTPAASLANCVMTLYLLKVHLQTFLSIPITQKCQILSRETLVAKERHVVTACPDLSIIIIIITSYIPT
jgi:hypothetical protein